MVAAYRKRVPIPEISAYLDAYPVGRTVPLPDATGVVRPSRVNSQSVVADDPADGFATIVLSISYSE
jgi:hypothetical protein